MRLTGYGIDYDKIAHEYDANPLRRKRLDPDLVAFISQRRLRSLAVLDVGCGTGNQLAANQIEIPSGRWVGLDPFFNMLDVAREKASTIHWVQGDGMHLPFQDSSFDYICNQFSYHHMDRPDLMIAEALRVCRPGGRLVLVNMTPHEMKEGALYEWFPETLGSDLEAHPRPEALQRFAEQAGFLRVQLNVQIVGGPATLSSLAEKYSQKTSCSQLNALPQDVFEANLNRLTADARRDPARLVSDHTAVLRLTADRPA